MVGFLAVIYDESMAAIDPLEPPVSEMTVSIQERLL